MPHQKRVAVGVCPGDRRCSDGAAAAGLVVHDEGLLQQLADLGSHDAGDLVGASTRGKADQLDFGDQLALDICRFSGARPRGGGLHRRQLLN